MAKRSGAYPSECDPIRVGAELDRLWSQRRDYPQLPDSGSPDWSVIAEWNEWRVGWHEAFRVQYARLGEWAWATGQPRAVCRAILVAEHAASTAVLESEASLTRSRRYAAEAAARADRSVA